MSLRNFYLSFYLSSLTYWLGGGVALLYVLSFFYAPVASLAGISCWILLLCVLLDIFLLYAGDRRFEANRETDRRFSNGDVNVVTLDLGNNYAFPVRTVIIDELPAQFQDRTWKRRLALGAGDRKLLRYELVPKERGEYAFGHLQVFVKSPLGLGERRYSFIEEKMVPVYPSFRQLNRFGLDARMALGAETGKQQVRRLGHSLEFEQIKEYVRGDDYRTINWKASARKGQLMINAFTEERSQQIFCVIDKGRLMKMPFEGMYLLDYAINAALVLLGVALHRQDKVGLVTFADKIDTFLPAERKPSRMEGILEALYNQQTSFRESDFENLYSQLRRRLNQRSLLILFTNFESIYSLRRQLPYLRAIGRFHLLVAVFFDNTELHQLQQEPAATMEEIYVKTIANRFLYEKKLMAKELMQYGILPLFTSPRDLTVEAVNKYLEIKARQAI